MDSFSFNQFPDVIYKLLIINGWWQVEIIDFIFFRRHGMGNPEIVVILRKQAYLIFFKMI